MLPGTIPGGKKVGVVGAKAGSGCDVAPTKGIAGCPGMTWVTGVTTGGAGTTTDGADGAIGTAGTDDGSMPWQEVGGVVPRRERSEDDSASPVCEDERCA